MSGGETPRRYAIHSDMTLLDVIARFRQTETVFRQYDEKAGVCLCCEALFEPLREAAEKYGLDLSQLISDLEAEIRKNEGEG